MVYAIWQAGWVEMGWRMIAAKNEVSGVLNARDQEALAVLSNIDSVPRLLFGEGWGGLIANPVAGGAKLRYVHNLFFFYLFKCGIVGLAALTIYLFWCFWSLLHIRKLFHMNHFVFLALLATMAPLVVAGWLEPMYKALSFGLVLCLWVAIGYMVQCRRLMGTERYAR
ncbi:hypothetical protein D6779_01435 [Candidatus Parcubacteria bacterium]|nr:MAG: hypothetical protein D6779_01435 [Candidatus Parcubacteria bacterium]